MQLPIRHIQITRNHASYQSTDMAKNKPSKFQPPIWQEIPAPPVCSWQKQGWSQGEKKKKIYKNENVVT